jgi:hypothetical protein
MNEFECVVPILNIRNFVRSMDYSVHQRGVLREPFDALR